MSGPRHWLMKTEPTSYSFQDLQRDKVAPWTGVRNYQARNLLRDQIQRGDEVFIYHSSVEPMAIAGIAEVVRAGYPDPTQFDPKDKDHHDPASPRDDPRWFAVDVRAKKALAPPVTLAQLKKVPGLAKMMLLQRSARLSVQPVTDAEWKIILAL